MDIVNFWEEQVKIWDSEQRCGFCWDFGAPLIESSVNVQQPTSDKECCVKVFFLQDKGAAFGTVNNYSAQTGYLNNQTCSTSFQLLVLLDSKLGINNFNEIKGHSTDESKWATIMQRLQECLQCDANLAFCQILGTQYRITNWSGSQVINYLDSVYCGYRINVTIAR